ncbi:MAG: hypothetical protein ABID38_06050 [Candidatus Diapherotrites archaeon]
MTTLKIVKTTHYKKYHKRFIPWSLVIGTIFTGKQKRKGKDFIEFKGKKVYVLCKRDKKRNILKVINAKRED